MREKSGATREPKRLRIFLLLFVEMPRITQREGKRARVFDLLRDACGVFVNLQCITAKPLLMLIVKKYPKTKAGAEAKELLEKLDK